MSEDPLNSLWYDSLVSSEERAVAGDVKTAKRLAELALVQSRETSEPARSEFISHVALGQVYRLEKDEERATECFERGLKVLKDVRNGEDYLFAAMLQYVAFYHLCRLNEFEFAVELQRMASGIISRALPEDDPAVAFSLFRFGEILYCNNENQEARQMLETAESLLSDAAERDDDLLKAITDLIKDIDREEAAAPED